MSTERRPRTRREAPRYPRHTGPRVYDEVIATNTGVRLACTMAAMFGLFGMFLCFLEHESRPIRRFAVQSATLLAMHVVIAAALIITGGLLGAIPYFGFLVTLMCWLCYIALLIVLTVLRVRLMADGWRGFKHELPIFEPLCTKYYETNDVETEEH